jgi:hypothetical protein
MIMTSTYPPPPYGADERTHKDYVKNLRNKAQADWMAEIKMLREQKD